MSTPQNVTALRNAEKPKRIRKHHQDQIVADAVWIRRAQFFKVANVGPTLGDQMIRDGLVKSVKVGKSVLIDMESVRALGRGQAA